MLNRYQAILPGKNPANVCPSPEVCLSKGLSPKVSLQSSLSKGLSPKVPSNLISMSFYANSHLQQSKPLRFSLQRSLSKGLSPKVSSNLIPMSFYAHSHLQQSKPLRFSLLQALERDPISLGNSLPIYSPPHFPCKLKLFIFQLASPPSIHMDSWWAACNLIQGPKWTHNTAYGRA